MDAEAMKRFTELLRTHRETIVTRWSEAVAGTVRGRLTPSELTRQVEEIYSVLLSAMDAGATSVHAAESAELRSVLGDLSRSRARHNFSATETAFSVFALKDAAFPEVDGGDATDLRDFTDFGRFVDELGLFTFETYANARDALISEQAEQLLELSTPVVKLWDGVVAVPLVGTLDSARAQVVMERLLQTLMDTGSPYAIIDITGVSAVDTQVAQHVLKTVVAAQLMGAQCIISGIRPQIAQTIVALGIEFGDIVTKANLADALKHALNASGMELVRRTPRTVV